MNAKEGKEMEALQAFRQTVDRLLPLDEYRDPRYPETWPKRTDEELLTLLAHATRSNARRDRIHEKDIQHLEVRLVREHEENKELVTLWRDVQDTLREHLALPWYKRLFRKAS